MQNVTAPPAQPQNAAVQPINYPPNPMNYPPQQAYPMYPPGQYYPPNPQGNVPMPQYPPGYSPQMPPNYGPGMQPPYPPTGTTIPPATNPQQPKILTNSPLDQLAATDMAIVDQQFELMEFVTGCETRNKYKVAINSGGQQKTLFFCKEHSGCCVRNCCTPEMRPFTMKIKHVVCQSDISQEDFTHPYATFKRPFKCTCCCCNRPEMTGKYEENNQTFGKIVEPCTLCSPEFKIFNKDNTLKYTLNINCCQCGFQCRGNYCGRMASCTFEIYNGNATSGSVVGTVTRRCTGVKNVVTDADTFIIKFPQDAQPEDKLMIIGAVLLIDYRYYETNGQQEDKNKAGVVNAIK